MIIKGPVLLTLEQALEFLAVEPGDRACSRQYSCDVPDQPAETARAEFRAAGRDIALLETISGHYVATAAGYWYANTKGADYLDRTGGRSRISKGVEVLTSKDPA